MRREPARLRAAGAMRTSNETAISGCFRSAARERAGSRRGRRNWIDSAIELWTVQAYSILDYDFLALSVVLMELPCVTVY